MATTQPIRDRRQASMLVDYYLKLRQFRNHVLVALSIHSALRICDLLALTWDDVYDFDTCQFRESVTITEQKTGKRKILALNSRAVEALTAYISSARRGGIIFVSRKGVNTAISRQQAHRIINAAAKALGFAFRVSCHSLRKTFGYLAWKANIAPVVIMRVFNHSSLAVTQRYLGLTQDDINECYHKLAELV